ncbi:MAG TPA: hypothetical protein P5550_01550 [Bacteroidales bacterium]|nr:hypothetical protein [Bacteroidales bacterium]
MMHFKTRYVVYFLLGLLSTGAFYGSIPFILAPDGSMLGMGSDMLKGSVFHNYLIPGIILFLVFGVVPLFTLYGLVRRPRLHWPEKLNLMSDHYWAWTFTIYIGAGLIIWINVQLLVLWSLDLLHVIYSLYGLALICIGLLPPVRKDYRIQDEKRA